MSDIPLDTRATESRHRKSRTKKIVTLAQFPVEWLSPASTTSPAVPEASEQVEEEVEEAVVEEAVVVEENSEKRDDLGW